MDDEVADLVERLRRSREPYWLRVIDDADLDGAPDPEPRADAVVEPYRLLLQHIGDGITATKAGYLPPAVVREITEELGWDEPWLGTSNRENDVLPTLMLRESAQDLGLIRRYRGQFVATRQARSYLDNPGEIWWHIADRLPVGTADPVRHGSILFLLSAAAGLPMNEQRIADGMGLLGWRLETSPVPGMPADAVFELLRGTWQVFDRLGLARRFEDRDAEPPIEGRRLARAAILGRDHQATRVVQRESRPVTMQHLRVTLKEVDPPVWRRIAVPDTTALDYLHQILQTAMGWRESHLHMFTVDGLIAGDVEEMDSDQVDASTFTVADVARRVRRFVYDYDFGDGWEHEIAVEDAVDGVGTGVPQLLDGARVCPPEDCGGPWGYARLRRILADPEHVEHADVLDWLIRCDVDPDVIAADALDLAGINAALDRYDRHRHHGVASR